MCIAKGFRIVLSPEVPDLIRRQLGHDVDCSLADLGRERNQVGSWVLHTGGPTIVMKNRRPAPGTLGLLAAVGSGFCSELVAPEW